jgi:hypothetical protein
MTDVTRIEALQCPLTFARVVRVWWPLAASWLLMGAELPALSAVMACPPQTGGGGTLIRAVPVPDKPVHLNLLAYGGVGIPVGIDHCVAETR